MVSPAPGAFGYAWISTLDVPAAIYCLEEHEAQWLIARSTIKSDGVGKEKGMGFPVMSRNSNEDILWFEWVTFTSDLTPNLTRELQAANVLTIDTVNLGDGFDLQSLRGACPQELLRAHEAWLPEPRGDEGPVPRGEDADVFHMGTPESRAIQDVASKLPVIMVADGARGV